MAKIKLDMSKLCDKEKEIETALAGVIAEAIEKRISLVEVITGKGNEHLRKQALRFLEKPETKKLYFKLQKDGKNLCKLYLHFRNISPNAYH